MGEQVEITWRKVRAILGDGRKCPIETGANSLVFAEHCEYERCYAKTRPQMSEDRT